jgi:hypothetical protein
MDGQGVMVIGQMVNILTPLLWTQINGYKSNGGCGPSHVSSIVIHARSDPAVQSPSPFFGLLSLFYHNNTSYHYSSD